MLPDYQDIIERIDEDPIWYDGNGVPRYEPFNPHMLGVYDVVAIHARIECQNCGQEFLVGEGYQRYRIYPEIFEWTIANRVKHYHYGDPPIHGCAGDTMNCIDLEVLEAWEIPKMPQPQMNGADYIAGGYHLWHRHEELEGLIEPAEDVWI